MTHINYTHSSKLINLIRAAPAAACTVSDGTINAPLAQILIYWPSSGSRPVPPGPFDFNVLLIRYSYCASLLIVAFFLTFSIVYYSA
jgi:hypothetical protein